MKLLLLLKHPHSAEEASQKLTARFSLTAEQCKAILELRLQRLTGLEQDKIYAELEDIKKADCSVTRRFWLIGIS